MLSSGGGDFPDDVALAAFPWTALHAVVGLLRGPQAKAVVMLGNHYDVFRAGGLNRAHPLLRIELGGVENFRVSGAVAPLEVLKSVRTKMDDGPDFEILPFDLLRGRLCIDEI